MRPTGQQLEILLSAVQVLKDLPVMKLAENQQLLEEIRGVVSGKNLAGIMNSIRKDYMAEKDAEFNEKKRSHLTPNSQEFLLSYARYRQAAHGVYAKNTGKDQVRYTITPTRKELITFNALEGKPDSAGAIKELPQTRDFENVFNSIYSDRSLQIGTSQDPTIISSYIDYSPYIYNYQYYLSIPTLSQTIDRSIQISTRELPHIQFEDQELTDLLTQVLKRSRFVEKLQKMLLYSHLSPRGSLIVPVKDENETIRFNVFNDTQFTYATGYQYTTLDFRDDGTNGVTQIYALGHLLQNGVTCHFLCPGFEPIYAIGKNKAFQLKGAAEAVNIYLYTIKVLCIRAQILVEKWGGEGQNDTVLARMRRLTADIDSRLSLSTSIKLPQDAEFDILKDNFSEGFSKVSPIIKEFQGMLTGINSDFFYGSDTAYNANSFNIHSTHQNIRSEIQEGQIEPIIRFVVNQYLVNDKRFEKWKDQEDNFDIEFASLYEPTDEEKAEIEERRINNLITMAGYPELQTIFKREKLLGNEYNLSEVAHSPPKTTTGEDTDLGGPADEVEAREEKKEEINGSGSSS